VSSRRSMELPGEALHEACVRSLISAMLLAVAAVCSRPALSFGTLLPSAPSPALRMVQWVWYDGMV